MIHDWPNNQSVICTTFDWKALPITEVDNLQGLYPLKEVWIISCSLKTRLVDQVN